MVQSFNQPPQGQQPPKVNLLHVNPGDRLQLGDNVIIEVVENPFDGIWLRGKYVTVPGDASMEGTEDQIFISEIRGFA